MRKVSNNINSVILPSKNRHHLAELNDILEGMDIILVDHANEVLERVLMPGHIEKKIKEGI